MSKNFVTPGLTGQLFLLQRFSRVGTCGAEGLPEDGGSGDGHGNCHGCQEDPPIVFQVDPETELLQVSSAENQRKRHSQYEGRKHYPEVSAQAAFELT